MRKPEIKVSIERIGYVLLCLALLSLTIFRSSPTYQLVAPDADTCWRVHVRTGEVVSCEDAEPEREKGIFSGCEKDLEVGGGEE